MKDKIALKSTFLESAEYDDKSQTMTLTFKTGSQYNYLNISPSTWLSFKQAPDHSSYYSRAIKGRVVGVPIKSGAVGRKQSSPLKANKLNRSLNKPNGNITDNGLKRSLKRSGLIPDGL